MKKLCAALLAALMAGSICASVLATLTTYNCGFKTEGEYVITFGQIMNMSDDVVAYDITMTLFFYDASGTLIDIDYRTPKEYMLHPGESTTFKDHQHAPGTKTVGFEVKWEEK
jgi:hypothetical protein